MATDARNAAEPDESREQAVPDEARLVASASRWMSDALNAWTEGDFGKVALLAPLAVEHLGKAVLWRLNPVLVVPLSADAEGSLLILATKPDFAAPKLRTIGLTTVLGRLARVLDDLPIEHKRRSRMIDVRNGAVHLGSPTESRHVLVDSLILCDVLLSRLDEDPSSFYGDHHANVRKLLDETRTEAGHAVAARRARARRRLNELQEKLGDAVFDETTKRLEQLAAAELNPDDFGQRLLGVDQFCPECGSSGRLLGSVDVDAEVDYDVEPIGGGQYESYEIAYWVVTLSPQTFACNVCGLRLSGTQELAEAEVPSSRYEVDEGDLGPDFDAGEFASSAYGTYD